MIFLRLVLALVCFSVVALANQPVANARSASNIEVQCRATRISASLFEESFSIAEYPDVVVRSNHQQYAVEIGSNLPYIEGQYGVHSVRNESAGDTLKFVVIFEDKSQLTIEARQDRGVISSSHAGLVADLQCWTPRMSVPPITLSTLTSIPVSGFKVLAKPSSLKVRAVFNSWERLFTPQLCYPDAIAYQTAPPANGESWESYIEKVLKLSSPDAQKIRTLERLETEDAVRKTTSSMLADMGVMTDAKLEAQMIRVFSKKVSRLVYRVTTTNGDSKNELGGRALAIVDLEKSEIVLLTDGDAFAPSRCAE